MTALTMSSLIFGLAINNKFVESKNATFNAHNYSYAIDLNTPTTQGGQYIPTDASIFGGSAYIPSVEGDNFVPSLY
jgi:hypothetical protein